MAPSELAADPNRKTSLRTPGERGRLSREQVAEVQRARIMRAVAQVVVEHGFSGASITQVAKAAGVSRATFYDLFENFEQCFLGVGRGDARHERTDRAGVRAEHHLAGAGRGRAGGAAERARRRPLPGARLPGGGTRGSPAALEYHARR